MDGYEILVKTDMWAALVKAREALFELQAAMERHGFHSDHAFAARGCVTDAENQLRLHFKRRSDESSDV